jgi:hypothetical protein
MSYVRIHANEKAAWRTVVGYLRENEGYHGPRSPQAIRDWLDQHEHLSVEVMSQKGLPETPPFVDRRMLTRSDRYLVKDRFILLTKNRTDPHPVYPFEAWAYEGGLDFSKAFANCYGLGVSIQDALAALNEQLDDWKKGKNDQVDRRPPGGRP